MKGFYQWRKADHVTDFHTPWHAPYSIREYNRAEFSDSRLVVRRAGAKHWLARWGGQGPNLVEVEVAVYEM